MIDNQVLDEPGVRCILIDVLNVWIGGDVDKNSINDVLCPFQCTTLYESVFDLNH